MDLLEIYEVDTKYVEYLRNNPALKITVMLNKDSIHARKYVGVLLQVENHKYFAPMSSPKDSDYLLIDGSKVLRNDTLTIIRIKHKRENGEIDFLGTIQLNHMIPVSDSCCKKYDIKSENDIKYKTLILKQYRVIVGICDKLQKNANVVYKQKRKPEEFWKDKKKPAYLDSTVDFELAEKMCSEYGLE